MGPGAPVCKSLGSILPQDRHPEGAVLPGCKVRIRGNELTTGYCAENSKSSNSLGVLRVSLLLYLQHAESELLEQKHENCELA